MFRAPARRGYLSALVALALIVCINARHTVAAQTQPTTQLVILRAQADAGTRPGGRVTLVAAHFAAQS